MEKTIDFRLLTFALKNKNFIAEIAAQTKENYYLVDIRIPIKILIDYYIENKNIPSFEVACIYAESYPELSKTKETLKLAYDVDISTLIDGDFPFYLKEIKKQYNDTYINGAIKYLSNRLVEKYDLEDLNEYIKKMALKVSAMNDSQIYAQGTLQESAKQRITQYKSIKENPELGRGVMSGFKQLDKITNGFRGCELIVVSGASGCHAKGQGIIMYDGSIKNVEDVCVGDQLIGPDSKPRNVLELCRGFDEMVEIIPVKGKSFVINKEHILSLQRIQKHSNGKKTDSLTGKITDIKVSDYIKWSNNQKNLHKLYRSPAIVFEQKQLPIDPYFLGLLLGDGSLINTINLTTIDNKIVKYIYEQASYLCLRVIPQPKIGTLAVSYNLMQDEEYSKLHSGNVLVNLLEKLGLRNTVSHNKFIPELYKTSSVRDRLCILAGLIDIYGSYTAGKYNFISKSQQLSNDVVFISRSLGLAAYILSYKKSDKNGRCGEYYRVCISGDTNMIPVKISHKMATKRKQEKNVLRTGFTVKDIGIKDNYYGFILDGDHRYLLDDFTVTHNSGKSILLMNMAINAWIGNNRISMDEGQLDNSGKNVWFVTIENSKELHERRIDSCLAGVSCDNIRDGRLSQEDEQKYFKALKFQHIYNNKKFFTSDLGRNVTMAVIEIEYEKVLQKFKPDLIVIDYLGKMKATNPTGQDWMDQGSVALDMYEFAKIIKDTPIISASQMKAALRTQNGLKRFTGDAESISRSKMIGDNISMNLQIEKPEDYNQSSYLNLHVAKNRDGKTGDIITLTKEFWKQRVCDASDNIIGEIDLNNL